VRNANPFDILRVAPDATPDEIWASYDALVRQCQADERSGAAPASVDRRMAELNWAIDEMEARRGEWVQYTLRSRTVHVRLPAEPALPQAEGFEERRGLPLLTHVFVLALVAGIGLAAWTFMQADDSKSDTTAAAQPGSQPPRTATQPAAQGSPTPPQASLAPINVEQVKEDIRRRHQPPGLPPLEFSAARFAPLTGAAQPDLVIQWPSGGTCGSFTEVWGYAGDKVTNLSPPSPGQPNAFSCGGVDVQDYLNNGRLQLSTTARTYDPAQFSGGEYLMRTVWCWTGSEFIPVVAHYETVDRKRLRSENIGSQQRCK
jgi:hypothetical protein